MEEYHINEKDIESVIGYLKIHDPKNADRDYAIQLLEAMQELAGDIARNGTTGELSPEQISQLLKSKNEEN